MRPVSVVMLVIVSLFLSLGQAVDQIVRGLVSDVAQEAIHQGAIAVQLVLNGLTN